MTSFCKFLRRWTLHEGYEIKDKVDKEVCINEFRMEIRIKTLIFGVMIVGLVLNDEKPAHVNIDKHRATLMEGITQDSNCCWDFDSL